MAALLASTLLLTHIPALGALSVDVAVCVALLVYEVLRYREPRAVIRSRRSEL
jgi:hypothetical protein